MRTGYLLTLALTADIGALVAVLGLPAHLRALAFVFVIAAVCVCALFGYGLGYHDGSRHWHPSQERAQV